MNQDKIYIISSCIGGLAILAFLLYRIKKIFDGINSMANDTLKRYDKATNKLKWSSIRLIGFQCFYTALGMAIFDCISTGFNVWVFTGLMVVAVTGRIPDAWSKKINPDADTKPISGEN